MGELQTEMMLENIDAQIKLLAKHQVKLEYMLQALIETNGRGAETRWEKYEEQYSELFEKGK